MNFDLIKDQRIKEQIQKLYKGDIGISTMEGERLLSIDGKFHQILAANMYMSALKVILDLIILISQER